MEIQISVKEINRQDLIALVLLLNEDGFRCTMSLYNGIIYTNRKNLNEILSVIKYLGYKTNVL